MGRNQFYFLPRGVLKGSFDKYADSQKVKRGTAEVDNAFLNEIEGWRDSLARNLALRNPALTQRELNFSVLRVIDRIIFLRMCEDREIEPYGQLQSLLNGTQVYPRLTEYFRSADDKYNSDLFHFENEKSRPTEPDELTLRLKIDDKILKDIFKTVYYPESPYEFSVFPSEILGQVYEQFLGKVITLTNANQYFDSVPQDVWDYKICGYQVLDKWLKDRKERVLTLDEIKDYCGIITA